MSDNKGKGPMPTFQAICAARYLELVSLQDRMRKLLDPPSYERETIQAALEQMIKAPAPDADYEEHA